MRHFAFPVCFILVAVPWLTPIEAPLVQWLMRIVAAVATETLTLFGIPAQLEGSLLRVNNGLRGVNESCTRVRSPQTSPLTVPLLGELTAPPIPRPQRPARPPRLRRGPRPSAASAGSTPAGSGTRGVGGSSVT